MTARAGVVGHPPTVTIRPIEREIYKQMWSHPEYRVVAPGENMALEFLRQANPKKDSTVLDFGCGTGRGGIMLALIGGMKVVMVDFADNCLDDDVRQITRQQPDRLSFYEADITKPLPSPLVAEYGYCTDVMEHIPPAQVDAVLDHCMAAAQHCFFVISTEEDHMGDLIGHRLHLTVQNYVWWQKKFLDRGAVIHWSREDSTCCLFYVSAWTDGNTLAKAGVLNTEEEIVKANVTHNIQQDWMQVAPYTANDEEVMIIGGSPSLNDFESLIRNMREDGKKLVALNGAFEWCLSRGIEPSGLCMVDARAFNARFAHPQIAFDPKLIERTKYFIASQCDPAVLEGLPKDRTYLWHSCVGKLKDTLDIRYPVYYPVPGGSTVLLRAIPMLRMLGFKRFHLFGCDSCLGVEWSIHHAYNQPENDTVLIVPVIAGGRTFHCHPWMVAQAQEFLDLIKWMGNEMEIEIYGDGLLAHLLKTGAELQIEKEQAGTS